MHRRPRQLCVHCDSEAWRAQLLREHSELFVKLRDEGYLLRLPDEDGALAEAETAPQSTAPASGCSVGGALDVAAVHRYLHEKRQRWLGRTVIHSPLLRSTQDLIKSPHLAALPRGTVVVADQQTDGRGRRAAQWMTPRGSLALSLSCAAPASTLSVPAGSTAAPRFEVQFVQYLAALALAESIAPEPRVRIKWPNDLLVDGVKVAGVLCEAFFFRDRLTVYVGAGVDVDNEEPTRSLNSFIEGERAGRRKWTRERVLSRFLVAFERAFDAFCAHGWRGSGMEQRYYARWLHSQQPVALGDSGRRGVIDGLSASGFLLVRCNNDNDGIDDRGQGGSVIELEPDVNSFDYERGRVALKRDK